MKNQLTATLFFMIWILLLSSVIGCSISDDFTMTSTESPAITPRLPSKTPTETLSSTPSPTKEVAPTLTNTPTQTLEPTATYTRVPTLIPEDMQQAIETLLVNNGDCILPCWWGINPGSTLWADAHAFLSQFDSEIYVSTGGLEQYADVYIPLTEELSPSYGAGIVDITIQSGIVQYVKVSSFGGVEQYSAGHLMDNFGVPQEILISTEIIVGMEFPFSVILYYPDLGAMFIFTELTEKAGDKLHVCLERGATLMLWAPKPELSFQEAALMFNWDVSKVPYLPIADATNYDASQFVEQNAGLTEDICIDTPADLWPQE